MRTEGGTAVFWEERGCSEREREIEREGEREREILDECVFPDVAIETLHGCWKRYESVCLRCYTGAE